MVLKLETLKPNPGSSEKDRDDEPSVSDEESEVLGV